MPNHGNNSKIRSAPSGSGIFLSAILLCISISAHSATWNVTVGNNFFSPNDLTIEVGDTVRWTNNAGRTHDVTADDGSWASETSSSFVYERTFNTVEEVLYHCSVHSSPGRNRSTFQNGRINVVQASAQTDVSVDSFGPVGGGSFEAGEDMPVKAELTNNGQSESGMFNIDFFISEDENVTMADTLIGTHMISNIEAGGSSSVEENVAVPANFTDGDYYIGAIIDIDDTNLDNNSIAAVDPIFVFTEFILNAGLNDAWYYPVTDGQGFFITIFPVLERASLAWFTYDTELPPEDAVANLGDPGHRWITASGKYAGNQMTLNIVLTSGGLFDEPTEVSRTDPKGSDGTFTITFKNCNEGTVDYDIIPINRTGSVPIQRIAGDNAALCDALLREAVMAQQQP